MTAFEYKVVPAPQKGKKTRGIKGAEARFAHAVEDVMNTLAADGWEYQRTDMLPSEERAGLTSSTTTYRSLMVFRRPNLAHAAAFGAQLMEPSPPELTTPESEPKITAKRVEPADEATPDAQTADEVAAQ